MAVPRSPKSASSSPNPNAACNPCPSSAGTCKHSLVDLLFLLLLLLSSSVLITSVLSYLSRSLSLLFPSLLPSSSSLSLSLSIPVSPFFVLSFLAFFALAVASSLLLSFPRSRRRCHRLSCKALNALEFDLQLQSEDHLRSGKGSVEAVERLPWKGGSENNPDYECLRAELRRMAPVNGRAVLLFREKCGCPVAKLVGWGPRKGPGGKKSKKALSGDAHNRKSDQDHRRPMMPGGISLT